VAGEGGASGAWLYFDERIEFACAGSAAQAVTLRGVDLPEPVVVDLGKSRAETGSHRVTIPIARVADVEKCPSAPRDTVVELELKCGNGDQIKGREHIRFEVFCSTPSPAHEVFAGEKPTPLPETLTEGAGELHILAPSRSHNVMPIVIGAVITDAMGREVVRAADLWKLNAEGRADGWAQATVPAPPRAGRYDVRLEGRFADGSTVLSASAPITVRTVEEASEAQQAAARDSANFFAVQDRIRDQHVDLCDIQAASAWLRAQPEVAWVSDEDEVFGSYTYEVRPNRDVLVSCVGFFGDRRKKR
jgi:hypothetical protein